MDSKIIVRCASHKSGDTPVVVPHDWPIRRLKEHLQAVLPEHPEVSRQKLIYAGKCLEDAQLIGAILKNDITAGDSDVPQVFHAVYSATVEQLREQREEYKTPTNELRQRRPAPPPPPAPVTAAASPAATPNPLYYWGQPGAAGNPGDWQSMQQQMYYNAYMANYMNYMNQVYGAMYAGGTAVAGASFNPGLSAQITTTPANIAQPAAEAQPEANNAEPAAGQVLNAQGGVDEEDGRQLDWLDWIYMGSRAALLTMILYFYSSIERFSFVMFCVVMMYGINAGWFGLRNNNQQQPAAPEQADPEPPAGAAGGAPGEGGEEREPFEGQSNWQIFWNTCFTFITTFFSSMIPERPPQVNAN